MSVFGTVNLRLRHFVDACIHFAHDDKRTSGTTGTLLPRLVARLPNAAGVPLLPLRPSLGYRLAENFQSTLKFCSDFLRFAPQFSRASKIVG